MLRAHGSVDVAPKVKGMFSRGSSAVAQRLRSTRARGVQDVYLRSPTWLQAGCLFMLRVSSGERAVVRRKV